MSQSATARMRGSPWQRIRERILDRDDYKCRTCNKPAWRLEVDHVVPLEFGGTNDDANLQTLCSGCHIEKTRAERQRNTIPGRREWRRHLQEVS